VHRVAVPSKHELQEHTEYLINSAVQSGYVVKFLSHAAELGIFDSESCVAKLHEREAKGPAISIVMRLEGLAREHFVGASNYRPLFLV